MKVEMDVLGTPSLAVLVSEDVKQHRTLTQAPYSNGQRDAASVEGKVRVCGLLAVVPHSQNGVVSIHPQTPQQLCSVVSLTHSANGG